MTESNESTFWSRLGEAMKAKGMKHNQTIASSLIGSKGNTAARKWKEGGYPNMANTVRIARQLDVCVEWLFTGDGPRYPADAIKSDTERRILNLWRTWSPTIKKYVVGQMKVADYTKVILELELDAVTEDEVDVLVRDAVSETGEFLALKINEND